METGRKVLLMTGDEGAWLSWGIAEEERCQNDIIPDVSGICACKTSCFHGVHGSLERRTSQHYGLFISIGMLSRQDDKSLWLDLLLRLWLQGTF